MEALVLYLGKTALALGAFFLAYLLLFQNRKQFQFNRIYLLASMVTSFLIPLVTFTLIREIPLSLITAPGEVGVTPVSVSTVESIAFQWEWYHFLLLLYASGILGGVIYLVAGHIKAMSIIRRSKRMTLCETEIHLSSDEIHPFSFFNRIVVPESALSHPDLPLIIDHERIHVAENHTTDILLAEILFLFQWFNPFAWLMRDAVKNNLEYKTDHVIVKSCDPKTYQLAMVSLADKKGIAPFLTAFNGSQLKNRIIMMKMKTENKNTWTRQLVLIPLMALLVTGLSGRNIKYEILPAEVANVNPGNLEQEAEKKVVVRKVADDSGKLINDTTVTIKGKPLYIVDGKEYTGNPDNIKPDEISSISVLKDQASLSIYGEKGKNGVVLINTKTKYNSDQVIITRKDSASSSDPVFFIVEEMPEFPGGEAALREFIAKTVKYPPSALEKEIMGKVYVTFVVSKEGKVTKAKIARGVHPDLDKEALRVVNMLPAWKPGMQRGKAVDVSYTVPVTFGIQGKTNTPDMFSIRGDKKPLIVLDGNITEKNISDINPNEIAAISVLKGENAIQKYGDKAKDGAIEITMKDLSIRITSDADFRKFIAEKIRYPVEAQKSNTEGTVSLWLKLDENGKIIQLLKESFPGDYLSLDEVVVVAYKAKADPAASGDEVVVVGYGSKSELTSKGDKPLVNEAGRVINMIPAIDIPEMKGKVVKVTVKFVLQ